MVPLALRAPGLNGERSSGRLRSSASSPTKTPSSASSARSCWSIFWTLVVVIVLACVFCFTGPVFQVSDAQSTKTEVAR